jgi:tyrosyl-tRNA synthetase
VTLPVLPGLDGVQRMSKSLGNYVGVADAPGDMYGKVMSLPDAVMGLYWRLVTDADESELAAVERDLADPAVHPMSVKKRLAHRIARIYHGAAAADGAARDFEAQFSRREIPEHLEEFGPDDLAKALGHAPAAGIVEVLVAGGIAVSKSAARRLVEQHAVSVDGEKVAALDFPIDPGKSFVVRAGRQMKRFRP